MRKSFSVIVMSTALLISGGTAAEAAGVATATSAGARKVIKTVSVGAGKGGAIVVKTGLSSKVIKTTTYSKRSAKPAAKSATPAKSAKPAKKLTVKMKVIKTGKRK